MIIRKSPFRFLRSRETALALLCLFLGLLLVSVIIPQKTYYSICEIQAIRERHPVFVAVVSKLAFDDIFKSLQFYALAGVLWLCLLVCTGHRALKIFFSDYFEVRTGATRGAADLSAPRAAGEPPVRENRAGYWTPARIRHAGSILFHISILVMGAGLAVTRLFGFSGLLTLTEGQTIKNTPETYAVLNKGQFHFESGPAFRIKLNRVQRTFSQGYLTGIQCDLGMSDTLEVTRRELRVNQPVRHRDEEFIISESGYAPHFVLQRTDSRSPVFAAYVNITGNMVSGPDSFDIPDENLKIFVRFPLQTSGSPPTPDGDGVFGIYGNELALRVDQIRQGGTETLYRGEIRRGESARFGPYALGFDHVRSWVILRGSRDPGRPITFAGFWICVAGLALRFAPLVVTGTGRLL